MKAIFFIIFTIYFYLSKAEDEDIIIYQLNKYNNLTFINNASIFMVLDCSDITANEIYITFINYNETFIDDKFYYHFTNDYPNNEFKTTKQINSYNKEVLNEGQKLFYKIKKDSEKYLVFKNIRCNVNNTIEIQNTQKPGSTANKSNSSAVIIIIIVSITVVIIIVVAFIFVGKYIYTIRQKEIMANYASSFVDDTNQNSSLVPDDNQEQRQEKNNSEEKKE